MGMKVIGIDMPHRGRDILGKTVISEETGRNFGIVGDVIFVSESGELLNLIIAEPSKHVVNMDLNRDENSRILIPFSSVKSVGDYVIISEKDIL
ncbi:MAG: PRC-barrel domain-containing protein [Candidatus Aenigmarchaeota archaeon]|nr:PRC-barrel domain-containing protein [Candidatus Aenigmarchaeota archaeon]